MTRKQVTAGTGGPAPAPDDLWEIARGGRPSRPTSSVGDDGIHERVPILGVAVSVVDMDTAARTIAGWIRTKERRYVCAADVHSVMRARSDEAHALALAAADMVTPDGAPLTLLGRLHGRKRIGRVSGPDLMARICEDSVATGWRHYLFGGAEGVPQRLRDTLIERYPGIQIVGACSPPFRPLSPSEEQALLDDIESAKPDLLWVGLGCPKQELWMFANSERLPSTVALGVGAAFDFHSGKVQRAPRWMRNRGLEWLHRLFSEPRRLWRRYILIAPRFAALSLVELCINSFGSERK